MTADEIINDILKREGSSFTNDPSDRGGPTKFGVTQITLATFRGYEVTPADVAALTEDDARAIYRSMYVDPWLGVVPDPILPLAVDCSVNHGLTRTMKMLQKAVGATADGILGTATRAALVLIDSGLLYRRLCAERVRLYGTIISNDPIQARFAKGWLNRAAEFIEHGPA